MLSTNLELIHTSKLTDEKPVSTNQNEELVLNYNIIQTNKNQTRYEMR